MAFRADPLLAVLPLQMAADIVGVSRAEVDRRLVTVFIRN